MINESKADVELLLQYGANCEVRTKDQWTPLHCACVSGNLEMVDILLNHGAELEAQTVEGWTPLICSSMAGNLDVCEMLIGMDASIEATDCNKRTSTHWAAEKVL
ncbi:ankyrin [Rhizoclosmatium globosum]|uniref:Ankyrin n=1 Tax=Rhizoclosmatium globosum TaxID=329046 RepID=A0A1Y2B0L6_9FUNG|nr:ankyrin [Rhizoclosmatium globosum]|eukprot:ORY28388.1 ankyrin [Rhizoclosmatium globosum]